MNFLIFIILISTTACMTATVHRDEWLACCKLCDKPQNMDYVTKGVYDADVLCHCKNNRQYWLQEDL